MISRLKSERRLNPRFDQELPVKIAANGFDFDTTTQNISCSGAYCTISKYIPPFTKIAVKLSLPIGSRSGVKKSAIECRGVVVRSEDSQEGGFNIAVFFNGIDDTGKQKINNYLKQFLP